MKSIGALLGLLGRAFLKCFVNSKRGHEKVTGSFWSFEIVALGCDLWVYCSHLVTVEEQRSGNQSILLRREGRDPDLQWCP